MRRILVALACVALSGCAVCQQHQTTCSIVASIAASCVITTIAMHEAKKQLSDQMTAALAGERSQANPQYGALAHP